MHEAAERTSLIHYSKVVRQALILFVLLSTCTLVDLVAQPLPPPVAAMPKGSQYFSGFVTSQNPSALMVSRKGSSKEMIHRAFIISERTKVEGKLRPNVRVTVRFETHPEGDLALRIIVREK